MNNTLNTLNTEDTSTVSMNTNTDNTTDTDFVDVFFDEPVATEENIVKPVTIDSLPDEDSIFIETPIEGGMTEETLETNLNQNENFDYQEEKVADQIGAPIVEPQESLITTNKNEVVSFDEFINNLSENVVGANKYISEVLDDKRILKAKEKELLALKEKLESQEQDFREYLADQNKILETSRKQLDDYIQGEKLRLESEIAQFKTEADATRSELVLLEENIRMKQQQLDSEKEQFEKHVKTESEIISDGHKKLDNDRKQFEKDKKLSQESIENANKELKMKQEEFNQYREFEERKLELESQNLAKSCARFKQIVSQLNSGFSQLQPKE